MQCLLALSIPSRLFWMVARWVNHFPQSHFSHHSKSFNVAFVVLASDCLLAVSSQIICRCHTTPNTYSTCFYSGAGAFPRLLSTSLISSQLITFNESLQQFVVMICHNTIEIRTMRREKKGNKNYAMSGVDEWWWVGGVVRRWKKATAKMNAKWREKCATAMTWVGLLEWPLGKC